MAKYENGVASWRGADRTDRARFLTQTEKYSRSC